jgi:hypothetical protein
MNLSNDILEFFKNNIKYTLKQKLFELDKKYPNFREIYDQFLKSEKFKKMINIVKEKHDEEYIKLFFRHSKIFLNLFIKDTTYYKKGRRLRVKSESRINNDETSKEVYFDSEIKKERDLSNYQIDRDNMDKNEILYENPQQEFENKDR